MSAPLQVTPDELRQIANALDTLTEVRRECGVAVGGYGSAEIRHTGSHAVLSLAWDDENGYTIDDRVGS